jgi:peptide/bleomycin uptake transporter
MFSSFFLQRQWVIWSWGGFSALIILTGLQVYILVLLNDWYKAFFNLLQNAQSSKISQYWALLITGNWDVSFAKLVAIYIGIATISHFLTRHFTFRWRQALTFFYIDKWQHLAEDIEGSSQRIQEDTQKFARILGELGLEFIESILKVIAFVAILWGLSKYLELPIISGIPGALVWFAIAISFGGMAISFVVGYWLPSLEYNNQRVEARFRKQLVYAEDDKRFGKLETQVTFFQDLRASYFKLFLHFSYFDLWKIFYIQSVAIFPYLIMAPSLFSGGIALGILMQTANAFGKVSESFSYYIRHWTTITELIAVYKRLREFELSLGLFEGAAIGSIEERQRIIA